MRVSTRPELSILTHLLLLLKYNTVNKCKIYWGDFVQGDFVLGGFCPGGFCPGILSGGVCLGGFCPDTMQNHKIDPQMGKTDPDLKTGNSSRLVCKIDNITVIILTTVFIILSYFALRF